MSLATTAAPSGRYVAATAAEHLGWVRDQIIDGMKPALRDADTATFDCLLSLCQKLQEVDTILATVSLIDADPAPTPSTLPIAVAVTPPVAIDGNTLRQQRYRRGLSQSTLAREMSKGGVSIRDNEISGAEHNRNSAAAAKIATWFHEHPFHAA